MTSQHILHVRTSSISSINPIADSGQTEHPSIETLAERASHRLTGTAGDEVGGGTGAISAVSGIKVPQRRL